MKRFGYGIIALCIALCFDSCRIKRNIVKDSREYSHTVTIDTARHDNRVTIDTLRHEQLQQQLDSLREQEDERIEIDYNDAGQPAVIRIHRERTTQSTSRTQIEQLGTHVTRDSIEQTVHVGGTDREVEVVVNERKSYDVGIRAWMGVLWRLLVLVALAFYIYKIGLWHKIRSIFSGR